jgi:L-2,4-diaminobutyric acid acetyltransferase
MGQMDGPGAPNGAVATAVADLSSTTTLRTPRLDDGRKMWELARDSGSLDLNSPYMYTLWCRDFASTAAVAEDTAGMCGFIIAYARPEHLDTLFIWQAAVHHRQRGRRLAVRMLEQIVGDKFRFIECTVTPTNAASDKFLSTFAASRSGAVERAPLFGAELFPDGHDPEDLFRIGPISRRAET